MKSPTRLQHPVRIYVLAPRHGCRGGILAMFANPDGHLLYIFLSSGCTGCRSPKTACTVIGKRQGRRGGESEWAKFASGGFLPYFK